MPEKQVALNLVECQEIARLLLPVAPYEYIAGGAGDTVTVNANRQAFERWVIVPRVLRGITSVDLSTTVAGQPVSLPVLFAPVAFQRLATDEGELAAAAAAKQAGTVYCLSTLATQSMEDVSRRAGPWWFQLYCYADREITRDLIHRAKAAGAGAILVTVDTPLLGRREADERNAFGLPLGLEMTNLLKYIQSRLPEDSSGSSLSTYVSQLWHSSLTWDDIEWIIAEAGIPVGVKGVLAPEDGRLAVEHGASIVVVSNHGGRQLDHSIATLDALPGVAEAVAGKAEVLLDGGVRRGTDVIKAIALGAKAVLIGRPYVWGLAMDGQAGASRVIEMLRAELLLDMHLCGCGSVGDIGQDLLFPAGTTSAPSLGGIALP